jgi:hypothetical protein
MKEREMLQQGQETVTTISAKAAPPAAVIGMQLMGVAVDDWIKWVTLAYVCLMVAHKLWHMGLEMYRFWVLKDRKAPGNPEGE